jgi:hypothetical protein
VLNITLDAAALAILKKHAPKKKLGALVSRLAYEHDAREQEKRRLLAKLQDD